MNDNTSWTPSPEDNLLGLTDSNVINEYEATGIAKAELFILNSDEDTEISVSLILEVHKIAFAELYNWAGKWRTSNVVVGQLIPPSPAKVPTLFYQFIENLNFKIKNVKTEIDEIDVLAYGHYEFVKIHPQ